MVYTEGTNMTDKSRVTMDTDVREKIKQSLKTSLLKYMTNFKYTKIHPLDLLIPKERKIRSAVGGLETSMGTTVWEPLARNLASLNGFEVVQEKILKPKPMPEALAIELGSLIALRENKETWISAIECAQRLKDVCSSIDRSGLTYVRPPSGTGVDVLLKKAGRYYAFDTKTVQPNLGSIKSFNKQILEWYAYSICKDQDIDIRCMIAYPYNPNNGDFWSYTPHTSGVLEPSVDALAENEFWDFISGIPNTYQVIKDVLVELNDEGFGAELSSLIEHIHTPTQN
jgi:hypothetical protein